MARSKADAVPPKTPEEVLSELRDLLASDLDDQALRTRLETLALAPVSEKEHYLKSFGSFTDIWGPALYSRNRVLFRPFILAQFSFWRFKQSLFRKHFIWSSERIPWKDSAVELDVWLAQVDRADDFELFRKLYAWKHGTGSWGQLDQDAWRSDLIGRFRAAKHRSDRNSVLARFDLPAALDEPTALALYEIDPDAVRSFVLKHLPYTMWGEDKRTLWKRLFDLAQNRRDGDLAFGLYRKQVPIKEWRFEALRLADEVADPEQLVAELERRHPEGSWLDLADTMAELARRRGDDALPYIQQHVANVRRGGWFHSSAKDLREAALQRGWIDLWAALIRMATGDDFNHAVAELVADRKLPETEVRRRLEALAGVSREWNFPGLGLAWVRPLKDESAVALYQRYPDLLRGPFRKHASPTWNQTYPKLTERAMEVGDAVMIDYLASRLVTRVGNRWMPAKDLLAAAERLSAHYEALLPDPHEFARRAGAVLGQVPAYGVWDFDGLLRSNRLARLLYGCSVEVYLNEPSVVRDLLESPEIHAQILAFRILGQNDDRARQIAGANLNLLLAAFLRPLHRKTRRQAFAALQNAADTLDAARRILDKAREALDLPDRKNPKEPLIGLIGQILHRWPELRSDREQPVVHGRLTV